LYPPIGFTLLEWQRRFLRNIYGTVDPSNGKRQYNKAYRAIAKKNGKALSLDTPIPTPMGWTTLLALRPGDQVFDERGKTCAVVAVSEIQIHRPCFEVRFTDGCCIVADAEHEWLTQTRLPAGKRARLIRTTSEIRDTLTLDYRGSEGSNHSIPVAPELELPDVDLPIPPYTLGAWLGDGTSIHAAITLHVDDAPHILGSIEAEGICWHEFKSGGNLRNPHVNTYRLGGIQYGSTTPRPLHWQKNSLQATLRRAGLLGNKHIPPSYLRASAAQRFALLQGLMDTDGFASAAGQCELTTMSERLRDDALELIRTLGYKPTSTTGRATINGRDVGAKYRIQFWSFADRPVFRLRRKAARLKTRVIRKARSGTRHIVSVNPVPSVPVRCIQVDSPSHLFLAGTSFVPTHNSFLCGGLPIFALVADQTEEYPQIYGAAASVSQAKLVYRAALKLIRKNPDLQDKLKVLEATDRVILKDGRGFYQVLSADGDVNDGIEPSLAILDELHRWKTRAAEASYAVITKGNISRSEPLVVEITTAGNEFESPLWFREHEYAQEIIDGRTTSETFYAEIDAADAKRIQTDPDYWKSKEARIAANPSHEERGGFLKDKRIVEHMNEAIAQPAKYYDYLRYHLNIPIGSSDNPAIEMPVWKEGAGPHDIRNAAVYDAELLAIHHWQLKNRPCFPGIDLAWTTDFNALSLVFPPHGKDPNWYLLPFFWIPEDRLAALERQTRQPLKDWVHREFLTATPRRDDLPEAVAEKIRWASRHFDIREIGYDPWNCQDLANKLHGEGFSPIEVRQGPPSLSAPTKKLLELVANRRLIHGNHPVLNWHASCLSLEISNDNCKPAKPDRDTAAKRIDGISATVTGMNRAILAIEKTSAYSDAAQIVI